MNTNVVLVQLMLASLQSEDERALNVSLVFDAQPTEEDLFQAFQEVPTVQRHPDFKAYRQLLRDCLRTYGIPKLDKFNMVDPEGHQVDVPMVYADWRLNVTSPTGSSLGFPIGSIQISRRRVHTATTNSTAPAPDLSEGSGNAAKAVTAATKTKMGRRKPRSKSTNALDSKE